MTPDTVEDWRFHLCEYLCALNLMTSDRDYGHDEGPDYRLTERGRNAIRDIFIADAERLKREHDDAAMGATTGADWSNITIDARGATSAEDVREIVQTALREALPLLNDSAYAYTMRKLRKPRVI